MSDDIDTFGDLIKEVPEAEQAIRDYQEKRRRRQVMAAAAEMMKAEARKTDELRAQLLTGDNSTPGSESLD